MINTNDLKVGMTIQMDGNIFTVLETGHVKPGKGAAFVTAKLKNLRTGSIIEQTFNSSIKVGKAMIEKKTMQYLYSNGDTLVFMDMEDYSQIELPLSRIEEESKYLSENSEVEIMYYNSEMLGVNIAKYHRYTAIQKQEMLATIPQEERTALVENLVRAVVILPT